MRLNLNLVRLTGGSILEQLQLEEALLRTDDRNWCIIQDGVDPSIVMGISGKSEEMLNIPLLQEKPVPLIRRFSGGGTVFVDRNTAFVTFIFQAGELGINPCPDKVFCWSDSVYRSVFDGLPYRLMERDYIFDDRKFGGNAQYMRKDRWLHHTTLLWDYDKQNMDYLMLPARRPQYRQDRDHSEFLCRLCDYLPARDMLWKRLEEVLRRDFDVTEQRFEDLLSVMHLPHRKSTFQITPA